MNKIFTWIGYSIATIILIVVMMYNVLQIQSPLKEAHIPQETIDFFNNLIGGDIGGIFQPDSIRTWGHYEDIDGMCKVEDSLFVVFYSQKDSVNEHLKAQIALKYANEAVKPLVDFMGNYPYPYIINSRKLPIYLANTVSDYSGICKQLGHGAAPSESIGLYCWRFSINGTLTDGIIISPRAWDKDDLVLKISDEDVGFKKTLWHEMNHFVFFTNLDLLHNEVPPLWVSEGCAEYFADNKERVSGTSVTIGSRYKNCHLDRLGGEYYNSKYDPYWVGTSAFYTCEYHHGRKALSDIVKTIYKRNLKESVLAIYDGGLGKWDMDWHQDIADRRF